MPWRREFPPVFVHCAWYDPKGLVSELGDHPQYWRAKKHRQAKAALAVCDDVVRDSVLNEISEACTTRTDRHVPIVVAPALSLDETQNALSTGYARWLADDLGWDVCRDIFQTKTVSRDFEKDKWFRIAHEPEFRGTVEAGRRYVIADDVCSMGGTIASLRGFIESKGGHVICMTALAAGDGCHVPISLAEDTLSGLSGACGGELPDVFRAEMGYGLECVTELEGRFLVRCSSVDAFRIGINGARDS